MFELDDSWGTSFPGAHAGFLVVRGVANPPRHPALQERKQALQTELRVRYAGMDRAALQALPRIQAYTAYYRRFGKSYHVLGQLESVALKGRDLPSVSALVEAMFMAEVADLLLTAGHDLAALEPPVTVRAATGAESYVTLRGQEQPLRAGDMMMQDGRGVVSSVLYGPDQRTRITAETAGVLFAVYAPAGIETGAVREHLERILDYARLFSPGSRAEDIRILGSEKGHA